MAKVMDLCAYRTVDTSTLEGLRMAERLQAAGWEVYSAGLFIIKFCKKTGVINDAS